MFSFFLYSIFHSIFRIYLFHLIISLKQIRHDYESVTALEIKPSIVFNLVFANNTILPCYFLFFFMIDLCFLIPAVIAQIFNLTFRQNSQYLQEHRLMKLMQELKHNNLQQKQKQENSKSNSKCPTHFFMLFIY